MDTWINVDDSANITGFGYDTEAKILTVEFYSMNKYEYLGVPENVFERMKDASSKGQFVAQNIKDKYTTRKV